MKEQLTQRLESYDQVSNQFGLNRFQTQTEDWYPSVSANHQEKTRAFQAAAARGRARARGSVVPPRR